MKALRVAGILAIASCAGPPEPSAPAVESADPEPIVVTRWSPRTELFMEYPPLRAGQTSRFAVHLTDLSTFEPLRDGQVGVQLDHGGGAVERFLANGPSRPGIFGVDVTPKRTGSPLMVVTLRARAIEDFHDLGKASVAGPDAPPSSGPSGMGDVSADGDISFLKEQQWNLEFATEVVRTTPMERSVRVPAVIEPRSGGRIRVTAPVSGHLAGRDRLPALGESVREHQTLGTIVPDWMGDPDRSSLQLAVDESRLAVEAAELERSRIERLVEVGAIAARRLDSATNMEALARARLKAASKRLDHFDATWRDEVPSESAAVAEIRSHLDGIVTSLAVTDGMRVDKGDFLLEIAATDSVHVSGAVPESQAALLRDARAADVELPGSDIVVRAGRPVHRPLLVDPATRTLKATFLVDNSNRRLSLGQSVFLRLVTAHETAAPTVPASALVDDGGETVVYVQTGGESFERRAIVPGHRRGDQVQAQSGLRDGERIVSRGAYLVRLASLSTEAPAHGHVH